MEKKVFNPGQAIYQIGDRSDSVYLLLSGRVGLYSPVDLTQPYVLHDQYEVFGETGVVQKQLRSSKAVCMEMCEVIVVHKNDFEKRLKNCDPLIKRLLETMIAKAFVAERANAVNELPEAA